MNDDTEIQIVLDRSGSMCGTPLENVKQAAQALVNTVKDGKTALGVATFETDVVQNQPITAIPDPGAAVKADINNVIGSIICAGSTSMFDGADLALTNLEDYSEAHNTQANRLVFLLSDGGDNDSIKTEADVISAYQAADVPLITIGYGAFAPTGVLKRLAENTGGRFWESPSVVGTGIQQVFFNAQVAFSNAMSVAMGVFSTSSSGVASNYDFQVDSTIESMSISTLYTGTPGDVVFSLFSPNGEVQGVTFNCASTSDQTSCIAQVDAATILAQGYGTWFIKATNTTGSDIDVTLNVIGNATEGFTYALTADSMSGNTITYPEPIILIARVSKDFPITGVNLMATITDPNGNQKTLPMNDDGIDGDGIAQDGTYSAIIGYQLNGVYKIEIQVNNSTDTAYFTRGGVLINPGDGGEVPPLPPITEDFTRTATIQITVTGFLSDDHPDTPPGTPMNADNHGVAGTIGEAGDVDYFQINNIDVNSLLNIRVTDLALGMMPCVTVFKSDGITEVASGNLDTAKIVNGYLLLMIPPAELDPSGTLVVKVTHCDLAATEGTYNISAGSALFSDTIDIIPNSGWNLISLYKQPANTDIADVLASISDQYISVWAYENGDWKAYDPAKPLSDLTDMQSGLGYYINMSEDGTLACNGTTPSKTINLNNDWNLSGYNDSTAQPIDTALSSITGKYGLVWAYVNGDWKVYNPTSPGFNDLSTMEPGFGYWIKTNQACAWTLP